MLFLVLVLTSTHIKIFCGTMDDGAPSPSRPLRAVHHSEDPPSRAVVGFLQLFGGVHQRILRKSECFYYYYFCL